eukprot:2755730-Lingulodinium_polyedra.AAC.1
MAHGWSMDGTWIVRGSSMDPPWILHGWYRDFHGWSMDVPRMVHGWLPAECPWVLPWVVHGWDGSCAFVHESVMVCPWLVHGWAIVCRPMDGPWTVSYTHLRAHETRSNL